MGPIAIDSNGDAYFIDSEAGEVIVQPAASAAKARLLTRLSNVGNGLREELFGIAIDDTNVYFTSDVRSSDGKACVYALRTVPKAGGVARVLAQGDAPGGLVTSLMVDDADVYFMRYTNLRLDAGAIELGGEVEKIPKVGGRLATAATGVGAFFAWALDGKSIYYFADRRRRIERVGTDERTSSAEVIGATDDDVVSIAADGGQLYFTVRELSPETPSGALRLFRKPKAGGKAEQIARYVGFSEDIHTTGGTVFWAEWTSETNLRTPLRVMAWAPSGGVPREVVSNLPRGVFWTVRNGIVYWGTPTGVASKKVAGTQ